MSNTGKIRCLGCGWLLTSYISNLARVGTQPEDILAGHLSLLDACTDAYRELGRVEYLYLAPPPPNPPPAHVSSLKPKCESGLVLAVAGTVRIVTKYAHSKNSYRISFVDARYGGERSLDAVFAERKKAEAALKKARADGEVELKKSGARDWRVAK